MAPPSKSERPGAVTSCARAIGNPESSSLPPLHTESAAPAQVLPIARITVGTRHRKDLGDIAGLAASIDDIGLLHPITVDEENRLLAGARRLAACKSLGWKEIPVNVVRAR
jgi:ParB/Sulfiredoxin domain